MAGWVKVEITSAGTITYSGHVHNDAAIAEAFDFRIRRVIGKALAILVQFSGHVGGTPQERNSYWTQTETRADIAANYKALVASGRSASMRIGRGRSPESCRRLAHSSAPGWTRWSWMQP